MSNCPNIHLQIYRTSSCVKIRKIFGFLIYRRYDFLVKLTILMGYDIPLAFAAVLCRVRWCLQHIRRGPPTPARIRAAHAVLPSCFLRWDPGEPPPSFSALWIFIQRARSAEPSRGLSRSSSQAPARAHPLATRHVASSCPHQYHTATWPCPSQPGQIAI